MDPKSRLINTDTQEAQSFPDRPIALIAPFAAGGTSDALARAIAKELSERLGQPVIVENRPGAGGTVGLSAVAQAEPDGYTIGLGGAGSLVHSAGIYKSIIQFDAREDFAPLGLLGTAPVVAVAAPSLGIDDAKELAEIARDDGELAFGTAGIGGAMHLAAEVFQRQAGVTMLHIPYGGVAPAMTEFLGGQIELGFFDTTAVIPHKDGDGMRMLGVASEERAPQLPDVPTFAEQGFDDVVVEIWYGLVAPAGTPQDVQEKLAEATSAAVQDAEYAATLDKFGFRQLPTGQAEMTSLVDAEFEKWLPIIEAAGITAQ